ncbi:MAG: hypothetical protein SWH68_07075 [Thermodesulfobacteriota bacterium]|nr:hypothetical protein [Thermodesulfobacteriota bacterium]
MADKFKIFLYGNSDNLHLKLIGVFDGSSAMELVHTIREGISRYNKIFVHTQSLSRVDDFGKDVFLRNFPSGNGHSDKLIFTGERKESFAPFVSVPGHAS